MEFKFGEKVLIKSKLVRREFEHYSDYQGSELLDIERTWVKENIPECSGMFLGCRTISDMLSTYSYEDAARRKKIRNIKVALVARNERSNPIYVPLDEISKATKGEVELSDEELLAIAKIIKDLRSSAARSVRHLYSMNVNSSEEYVDGLLHKISAVFEANKKGLNYEG